MCSRLSAAAWSALFLALVACGNGDTGARSEAGNNETPATTIHLVVGGGTHAGTYDAGSSEITCTYGFAGPGSWGNQYSVTGKLPEEFSSLQLVVPDTKDAADGTNEFRLTAGFGGLMQAGYTDYRINTLPRTSKKEGSGTVTVDDRGQSGMVTFKGRTEADVTLEGTIDCHKLMRGEG